MERPVIIISEKSSPITFIIGHKDTIGDLKNRIWTQHSAAVSEYEQSSSTLSPLPYQQIIHEDTELLFDILAWNHLYEINLPTVPTCDLEKLSARFTNSSLSTSFKSDIGLFPTAIGSGGGGGPHAGTQGLPLPNNINDNAIKPAVLYIVPKHHHCQNPNKAFQSGPHHFINHCQMKVKSFLPTYTYDSRWMVVQGYMIYIYKSIKDICGNADPLEAYHIGGVCVYNIRSRASTNLSNQMHNNNSNSNNIDEIKNNIVIKSNDLHLAGPSALSIAAAFKSRGGGGGMAPGDDITKSATNIAGVPKNYNTLSKSALSGMQIGGNSKDDVVFLVPPAYRPTDDLICGDFKRTDMSKPQKGFLVLQFENHAIHQQIYEFLSALKYQWLTEICANAATYLERRKLWVTEGIFRLSASQTLLEEIKHGLYSGQYLNISTFKDEHLYSNLIKVLIRELPECPLSSSLYHKWLECFVEFERMEKDSIKNNQQQQQQQQQPSITPLDAFLRNTQQLLQRLPYYVRNFLSLLIPLLHHVAQFSTSSKMGYPNLSIVFTPNLLRPPISHETLQGQLDSQRRGNDLVTKLIEKGYHNFYPVDERSNPLHDVVSFDIHQECRIDGVLDPIIDKKIDNNQQQQHHQHQELVPDSLPAIPVAPTAPTAPVSPTAASVVSSQLEPHPENEITPQSSSGSGQLRNDLTVSIPGTKTFITPVSPIVGGSNSHLHASSRDSSPISSRDDSQLHHMVVDTPKIQSIVFNMNLNQFDPSGGFNNDYFDAESVAGSQYDQNRVVELPTQTPLPPPPSTLPELPTIPTVPPEENNMPLPLTPTGQGQGALIDDDDDDDDDNDENDYHSGEFYINQVSPVATPHSTNTDSDINDKTVVNQSKFNEKLIEALKKQQQHNTSATTATPTNVEDSQLSERQQQEEYDRQQQEEYERQQRELDEEELLQYQKLQNEKDSRLVKERECRQQLSNAIAAFNPFFVHLQDKLQDDNFVVSSTLQNAIWDLVKSVEETSQIVNASELQ